MSNVLVTGGAGFIGSNMSKKLVSEGYHVTIVDNLFRGSLKNIELIKDDITFYEWDLTDSHTKERLEKLLTKIKPTHIFHYAAINGTEYFYDMPAEVARVNSVGTYYLMEAVQAVCRDLEVRPKIIFASTSEVYGEPFNVPTKESDLTYVRIDQKRDSYAAAKLMSEFYVRLYSEQNDMDYLILRIFNVFGPGMIGTKYGQVIPEFISRLKSGEYPLKILGDGRHTRSFCFIEDHVNLTMKALESTANRTVLNIGNPYEVSIKELAKIVMSFFYDEAKIAHCKGREGDHLRRNPSLEKLFSYIGDYEFIPLREGVQKSM